jgi:copper transport protein
MAYRRWLIVGILLLMTLLISRVVSAHAELLRVDPTPNSRLDAAPQEIRLWFSEPLEASFSKIFLRDSQGNIVQTVPSQVDSANARQMFLRPGALPPGLYTVVWRGLSAADGHATAGSYPLMIGSGAGGRAASQVADTIPAAGSLVRWFNLLSLALGVGGLGFILFVWTPAVAEPRPPIERRMTHLVWVGWLLIGITGIQLLLLQLSVAQDVPLLNVSLNDSLGPLIADTRFGHLWLLRMALWVGMGGALAFAPGDRWFYWIALALGGGLLAVNSIFSHATAAPDAPASVAADWLHLAATALWVGGLMQFFNVIGPVRRAFTTPVPVIGRLVAAFTNFARVSVAILIITGLYAAWLQVGSVDALLHTQYGQALLIKLLLILPLLGLALVNLLFTSRGLAAGQDVWAGRLRGLVSAEIVLTIGVLGAVGVMTSIAPARSTYAQQLAQQPTTQPIVEKLTASDLTMELTISPGTVGVNTFTLRLTDAGGAPVDNATLIRMRFESETENNGESELRPTGQGNGIYTISGGNLSVPGEWRIRTTVQRENQFDALADFRPTVAPPPPPPVIRTDADAPLPGRIPALLVAGLAALLVGGFFAGEGRLRFRAATLLGAGLVVVGAALLTSGISAANEASVNAAPAAAVVPTPTQVPVADLPPDAPVKLDAPSNGSKPYLITAGGSLLEPTETGWTRAKLDTKVQDVYVDAQDTIWAATDGGLYSQKPGADWQQLDPTPIRRLDVMHGYVFALGQASGQIRRAPQGGLELEPIRRLTPPLADQPAAEFVMLGTHDHVLQNGDQVYLSPDLGLSWKPLNAPFSVNAIWVDPDGNLLAVANDGIHTYQTTTNAWSNVVLPLPGGDPAPTLRTYNNALYALAFGHLYILVGQSWARIDLPQSDTTLTALEPQYPNPLWALDARGARLWKSQDGKSWSPLLVNITG